MTDDLRAWMETASREALVTKIEEMDSVLVDVQWSCRTRWSNEELCPSCGRTYAENHGDHCPLWRARRPPSKPALRAPRGGTKVRIRLPENLVPARKGTKDACDLCWGDGKVEFYEPESGRDGVYDPCPQCDGTGKRRKAGDGRE